MKKEIRILGIDDSSFRKSDKEVLVIGTFFRGGMWLDGVICTRVEVDGDDSTQKLIEMIDTSRFNPQIQCIMLDGIALGGFNIVDISILHEKTGIPVISVMRKSPRVEDMMRGLESVDPGKLDLLEKAGQIHKAGKIHIQFKGITLEKARDFVRISCTRSNIPEPIRIAHIIGRGIGKIN